MMNRLFQLIWIEEFTQHKWVKQFIWNRATMEGAPAFPPRPPPPPCWVGHLLLDGISMKKYIYSGKRKRQNKKQKKRVVSRGESAWGWKKKIEKDLQSVYKSIFLGLFILSNREAYRYLCFQIFLLSNTFNWWMWKNSTQKWVKKEKKITSKWKQIIH